MVCYFDKHTHPDEDTFATIWKQAEQKFDEHGNENEVGVNGFHSFRSYWQEHPDRDEKWKEEELGRIGEERFRREYDCEFLVFDETLINSIKLATMEGDSPCLIWGKHVGIKNLQKNLHMLLH